MPRYFYSPKEHPKYGGDAFFQGIGTSSKSFDEAQDRAKKELSNQINSKITSIQESRIEEIRNKNDEKFYEEFKEWFKIESNFSHGELIHIDHNSSTKKDNEYYVFAYLSKRELSSVLRKDYKEEDKHFPDYIEIAKRAFIESDVQKFTLNYKDALKIFKKLESINWELKISSGSYYEDHEKNSSLFNELTQKKIALKSLIKFRVTIVGNIPPYGKDILTNLFQSLLSEEGLSIDSSLSTSSLSYNLEIRGDENCKVSALGPMCQLNLIAYIYECKDNNIILTIPFESSEIKGVHPTDNSLASKKLYNSLSEPKVKKDIQNTFFGKLGAYFPL